MVVGLLLGYGLWGVDEWGEAWAEPPAPVEQSVEQEEKHAADRALRFLAREMETWPAEYGCYSCHNNGDGARAIYHAMTRQRFPIAVTASDSWLKVPARWQLPEGPGPEGDQRLADLQFALATEQWGQVARKQVRGEDEPAAVETAVEVETVLSEAVERMRAGLVDGTHWPADPTSSLGSPVTYGPHLGTALARQLLGPGETPASQRIWRQTRDWLLADPPQGTLDAASRVLGLTADERRQFVEQVAESRRRLLESQQPQGAWGPYANSRPEVFDTAIALLALVRLADDAEIRHRIARGRRYLLDQQWENGSWTETTRPGGRESYAQRISTTAWGAMALIETEGLGGGR